MALLAALALALVVTPAAQGASACASAPVPGGHTIRVLGRPVLVHTPHGIPAGHRVPLVLALHGAGGNGAKMEHYSGFSHASDLHHFIVAYPYASGGVWNITGARSRPNDVGYLSAAIAALQQDECVDPLRTFATGVSNGAGMVALLGCALDGKLAAIAPVAGIYPRETLCHASYPMSVLEIHGTADQVAPYSGIQGTAAGSAPPPFVRGWVHRDRCRSSDAPRRLATRTTLYQWSGCAGRVSVQHVRILAGAHQWPGALPPDPGPPSTICAACEIWSFFSRLSLPAGSANGGVGP